MHLQLRSRLRTPDLLHSHLDKVDFLKRAEARQHEQRKAAEAVERAARAALQDA
jgi:hypothetical protein